MPYIKLPIHRYQNYKDTLTYYYSFSNPSAMFRFLEIILFIKKWVPKVSIIKEKEWKVDAKLKEK